MTPARRLVIIAVYFLSILACETIGFPQLLPAATPSAPLPPLESPTLKPFPTLTPAPTATPPYPTVEPLPAWIAEFAEPILKAIVGRPPDIKDEFSRYNQGWFIVNSENRNRPLYATMKDGALYLQLPAARERKDLTVYHHAWAREDFVLSFDFKFGKTEPNDILRFQYGESAVQSVFLDLSKNENWTFHWSLHSGSGTTAGTYDYFSPEYLNVTVIMRGDQCAVYLNHEPVDYSGNCRPEPVGRLTLLTMTFHLLSDGGGHFMEETTGQPVLVIIDHVKLWDLDK